MADGSARASPCGETQKFSGSCPPAALLAMESAAPIAALNPNAELLESRACTVLFTIIRESTTTQRDVRPPHPTPTPSAGC